MLLPKFERAKKIYLYIFQNTSDHFSPFECVPSSLAPWMGKSEGKQVEILMRPPASNKKYDSYAFQTWIHIIPFVFSLTRVWTHSSFTTQLLCSHFPRSSKCLDFPEKICSYEMHIMYRIDAGGIATCNYKVIRNTAENPWKYNINTCICADKTKLENYSRNKCTHHVSEVVCELL